MIKSVANKNQRLAIQAADGPLLITAGPGTGKTFTLVQRAIHLIQKCGAKPEEILLATFTEKAAKELVTRITDELARRNITANLNEMYIGTFHSLCLRLIKENLEFTRLKKNHRTLDGFDQCYTVLRKLGEFKKIPNYESLFAKAVNSDGDENETKLPGTWKQANTICDWVNKLAEELVEPVALKNNRDPKVAALGAVLETYQQLLDSENLLDFAAIQTETLRLLQSHPGILAALRKKIRFVMIDEYQDTNYVQEQIVFLLGGDRQKHLCRR